MIDQLAATACFAAPCVPLAGVVALRTSRSLGLRSLPRGVALCSTCLSLALALVSLLGTSFSVELGNWLAIPGTGSEITLGFHGDDLARSWLVVIAAAAVGASGVIVTSQSDGRTAERLLAASAFSQLAAASGGLLQFLACSQLAVVFAWSAVGWSCGRSLARAAVISDSLLLISVLALWSVGVEPSVAALNNMAAVFATAESAEELSMMQAVTGFAATCLVGAFLVKCGQFPFGHWLIAGSEASREFTAVALLTVLPHGAYLLLRGWPLLAGSPETLLTLGGIACLSAVLGGMMALTAEGLPQASSMFVSGACSLAAIAMAQAGPSGAMAAIYVSVSAVILCAVLLPLVAGSTSETSSFGVAALVGCLTCGLWGQDAVLRLLWSRTPTDVAAGPLGAVPLFPILVLLAHGLLSAGMFLNARPPARGGSPVVLGAVFLTITLPVMVAATLDRSAGSGFMTLLRPGMCSLAMLIGLIGACLKRRADKSGAVGGQRSGLMELSQRRFYLGEFGKFGWELPLRAASRTAAFAESAWRSEVSRWTGELGLFESVGRDQEPAHEPERSTALLALILVTVTALTLLIAD